jgi:hypothetical protein
MDGPTDTQLKSMARSLQEHINQANELNLGFTAQLLSMALMEITTKIYGITQQELAALCDRIEQRSSLDRKRAGASVIGPRSFDRRAHARRSRM